LEPSDNFKIIYLSFNKFIVGSYSFIKKIKDQYLFDVLKVISIYQILKIIQTINNMNIDIIYVIYTGEQVLLLLILNINNKKKMK